MSAGKLFAVVFAAVLAAGAVLFAVHRGHVEADRARAQWEAQAERSAGLLREGRALGESFAPKLAEMVRHAEAHLAAAPAGADTSRLWVQVRLSRPESTPSGGGGGVAPGVERGRR